MKKLSSILMLVLGILMIGSGVAKLVGALAEEAVVEAIPFETAIDIQDADGDAAAMLASLRIYCEGEKGICVDYALTNNLGLSLTAVRFTVQYFDADGNTLREAPLEVTVGMAADPLMPGETWEFTWRHWFDGAQTAASVALEPVLAETELTLPPWTEPQPNSPLLDFCNYAPITEAFENLDANPPVELVISYDEELPETITDVDQMLSLLEGFRNMRVGEETDMVWTDSAIGYDFTLADGTHLYLTFNAPGIFTWHGHNYEVLTD